MANSFGERLKFLRAANNLSQQELAELVGISRKQISDYEVRNSIPRSTTIYKLAQALMVKPTDLLPEDLNKEDHLPNRLPSLIKLHTPPKIYDRLLEATEKNNTSLNQEIIDRIKKSFELPNSDITQIPTENLMMELTSRFKGHSIVVIDNQDIKKAP